MHFGFVCAAQCIALCTQLLELSRAQSFSDPRELELKQLYDVVSQAINTVPRDNERIRQLTDRTRELCLSIQRDKATRLHDLWVNEVGPDRRRQLGKELISAAVRSGQPEIVVEVSTGGTFARKEILIPEKGKRVPLKVLRSFPFSQRPYSTMMPDWVIRRMTRTRFELWMPSHGWLFDSAGRVLNEAEPPRRDGRGREWFGAFLPDGRWVTTDLWEMDTTLWLASGSGKLRREIRSIKLMPYDPNELADYPALIGWCRCDRHGNGFVFSVGANGGWGIGWTDWNGNHRKIDGLIAASRLCYPRDLEPKGMYTRLSTVDDSGTEFIEYSAPGHGSFVGFPHYSSDRVSAVIPEGERFGFWPKSHNVYIVSGTWEAFDLPNDADRVRVATERTWFYNSNGTFAGWIAAGRIADSKDGSAMLFRDATDRVLKVTQSYRLASTYQFVWSDGRTARPFKLFADLGLGFFIRGRELILARWSRTEMQ